MRKTRAHLLMELAMGAALASVLALAQIGHARACLDTGDEIMRQQRVADDGYASLNSMTLAACHGGCR